MLRTCLSLFLTAALYLGSFAQLPVSLAPSPAYQVQSAQLSADGRLLVVARSNDTIAIRDADNLSILQLIPFAASANGMRLWHTIGKKSFHITKDNNLLYLEKRVSNDSLVMYLVSRSLENFTVHFRQKVNGIAAGELVWPTDLQKASFYYDINGNSRSVSVCIENEVKLYDTASGQMLGSITRVSPQSASISPLSGLLAILANDTVEVMDRAGKSSLLKHPVVEATGVQFLSDSLLAVLGKNVTLLSIPEGKISAPVYHSSGEVYGAAHHPSGLFALSGAQLAFPQQGFTAAYDTNLDPQAVFHLAENTGFTSFFHPAKEELWTITAQGSLYRFELQPEFAPRPVPQRGHQQSLTSVALSADKRYMLSTSNDREIILWDIPTGRVLERYATNESLLENAIFAENQRDILYKAFGGFRKIHRSIPSNWADGLPDNVFLDPASEQYTSAWEKNMSLDSIEKRALAVKFQLQENNSVASSGTYVAGIVRKEYTDLLRIAHLPTNTTRDITLPDEYISFWEGSPLAFFNDRTLMLQGINNTIVFIDVETGEVVKRLGKKEEYFGEMFSGVSAVHFNKTGDTLFTVTNQRVVDGWDLKKGERFFHYALKMHGVNQEDALNYENGTLSLFLQNGQTNMLAFIKLNGEKPRVVAYADTTFVVDVPQGIFAAHKAPGLHQRVSLSPDAKSAFVLRINYLDNDRKEVFADRWDLETMKVTATYAIPGPGFARWEVSWEHQKIAVWDYNATAKAEQENLEEAMGKGSTMGGMGTHPFVSVLDWSSGKMQELSLDKLQIFRVGRDDLRFKSSSEIYIRDDYHGVVHTVALKQKKVIASLSGAPYTIGQIGEHFAFAGDSSIVFAPTPGSFDLTYQLRSVSLNNGKQAAESNTSGTHITCMSKPSAAGTVALGLMDNSISIRDSKTLHEKYRIFQNESFDYLFITPDHYYKADRRAASTLFFNWNFKTFSLNQFDVFFNRPDRVLAATGFSSNGELELMKKAYEKRTRAAPSVDLKNLLSGALPEAAIVSREEIPFQSSSAELNIEVKAFSRQGSLSSIHVLANGVPLFGKDGISVAGNETEKSIRIPLLPGTNKISVYCQNSAGVRSLGDEVVVERTQTVQAPDLYFFGTAIDAYRLPALNLQYAVKDARDLTKLFAGSKSFSHVYIDTLFNRAVTAENVLALKSKLMRTKPEDVVVVFFAGHGFLDENFDFRYALWDMDPENPGGSGLLYSELEALLEGIPARNKLMLVDACHSGTVDKDEIIETTENLIQKRAGNERTVTQSFTSVHHNVFKAGLIDRKGFELMQELFFGLGSNSGAQVVVATAGDRTALESEEWQNGVFTYSIIKGLTEMTSDLDNNGVITTDELVNYLKPAVQELTGGKQTPRFREENIDNHFVIWR